MSNPANLVIPNQRLCFEGLSVMQVADSVNLVADSVEIYQSSVGIAYDRKSKVKMEWPLRKDI